MKIAIVYNGVVPPPFYGGVERLAYWYAAELIRRGHQVTLLAKPGSRVAGARVVEMPPDWMPFAENYFLQETFDFVHFQEPFRRKCPFPHLTTIYGNAQPGEVFEPETCFVSRSHAHNHGSQTYVYNCLPVEDFPFVQEKEDYYVFMANNRRVKNLKTAVAWARDLGMRLDVIGVRGVSRHGIRYHGPMGEKDGKLEILGKARAMISPYNWAEPFAVAPLEALACGTPLISSANGSLPEVTAPQVGVVCRNYEELLQAPSKLAGISPKACRDFVAKNFSVGRAIDGYLDLYEQIRGGRFHEPAPKYVFPDPIKYLYKPTLWNRLVLSLKGRI